MSAHAGIERAPAGIESAQAAIESTGRDRAGTGRDREGREGRKIGADEMWVITGVAQAAPRAGDERQRTATPAAPERRGDDLEKAQNEIEKGSE
jgi:hypothetical protein